MLKPKRYFYPMILGLAGIMLVALILISGCTPPKVAPSGFLSNYGKLRQDPVDKEAQWWEKSGIQWHKYRKLILDPVETRIDQSKSERKMTQEEIDNLANHLRQTVIKEMQDAYPVVDTPGTDVLRIRAALTHLKPVSGALNVITTAALFMPVDVGEAAIEVQFLDSRNNEILSELIMSSRGSMMDVTGVWTRWSQVESTFKEWAEKLKAALDEATRSGH